MRGPTVAVALGYGTLEAEMVDIAVESVTP